MNPPSSKPSLLPRAHSRPLERAFGSSSAFTLIELLTVVGISVLMTAVTIPALNALKNSSDVTSAAYDISGIVQVARTYAMTNNTYVYVGFEEVNASQSSGSLKQTAGVGRLAVVAAAREDGTPGYSSGPSGLTGWAGTTSNTGFVQVAKLLREEDVHLPQAASFITTTQPVSPFPVPTSGNMSVAAGRRDTSAKSPSYELMSGSSVTTFNYPINSTTSPQYTFSNVIQFDPQGSARVLQSQGSSSVDTSSVPWCIEVCLQQSHGSVTPPAVTNSDVGNQAILQIDGMTGGVRIFRP